MTAQEKIQEILDKCSKGNYIYRGENEEHEEIATGLYRQYCQPSQSGSKDTNLMIQSENFFVSSIEKDIVDKAKQHIRYDAPNIEVLTELQHYGGKTALLDFTNNIHMALFFACDGNFDQDGRIILFEKSKLTEKSDINYKQIEEENKTKHAYALISPTGKSPRVIFQSSIFVHVPKGYLKQGAYETIQIKNDIKEAILKYLNKHFNIKTETIYNDIQGFIDNQHNYSNASIEFYRGRTRQKEGEHGEAINNYNNAIKLDHQYDNAYYNRGIAKNALGSHEEAIIDYDEAIEIDPKFSEAYNNRGIAKNALVRHEEAIIDYDKAIKLDPKFSEAYNNRGIAKNALGKHKGTIKDYSKAIKLNPKYANAYYNRGATNADLKNYEDAIKDYGKAKKLYEKEDNMEMAKQCEKAIKSLKN